MIDIKLIRENSKLVRQNTKNRDYDSGIVDKILELDNKWKKLKKDDDDLRHKRNQVSEEINQAKKNKDEKRAKEIIINAKKISDKIKNNEEEENKLRTGIDDLLSRLPNVQADDVPVGDESKNKEVKKWGRVKKCGKGHLELTNEIDMKGGAKIAGTGFYILRGKIAKLQRALVQFMLDFHIKNGFVEINPPQLVNAKTMFGTGNLPKFEDDLYKTREGLYPIPTAEVPVTNLHADEILLEKELPKKYCSFTQCYRTEAGRHTGEEGLFRLHQFEKVEMVYICKPEDSWKFLEEMTGYAEDILKALEMPYRKIVLATGDASFASAKTYDLEVWSCGMGRYLETSSCSNCTDFQARRMNTKFQSKEGLQYVHTLNGSGLALPRLMIALIENNQQKDGSIKVPKVLWKYCGFRVIKVKG